MKVLFTGCWVGCYQGEGSYEGGTCPDCLVTNVPEGVNHDDVFDMYLMCLCNGFNEYDKVIKTTKVVKRTSTFSPTKIDSLNDLIDCDEEFIEVDFNDLINWIDTWLEEDEDEND